MEETVHHRGRRFRRTSARASSAVKDGPHRTLPPPTPPSGKDRSSTQAHASKEPFPYQRFKPLPSIGSTSQTQDGGGEDQKDVVSADSAVDLTSPSPSSTEIRGSIAARTRSKKTERKHLHESRGSSQEGRTVTKTAKIDASPPVVHSTDQATTEGNIETSRGKRTTRGKSKSKARGKRTVVSDEDCQQSNIKEAGVVSNEVIPPEPPKDAPNTVILKVRLLDGECIQRRFNYKTSYLREVVQCAESAMNSKDVELAEKRLVLSSNYVPKVVFSDLSLTLEQAGLIHNTLLQLDCEHN